MAKAKVDMSKELATKPLKKKSTAKPKPVNRLERYELQQIPRSMIKNAPYNPRTITADAEKKLRKSLRDFGALAPITWNKTTSHIVGGHRRIEAMDSILRKQDYEVTVAVVELSLEDEVKANIVLNNPAVQGEWDNDLLAEIKIDFPEIDFEKDLGFDRFDIDLIFAGTDLADDVMTAFDPQEDVKDEVERMREIDRLKAAKKKGRDASNAENEEGESYEVGKDDYMVTFVFPNNSEKHDFMKHIGERPKEKHVRHTKLYDIQDGKIRAYGKMKAAGGK